MEGPLRPGDIVADKYRIERVLGMGGMGVVLAAEHVQLGHLVALKVMRSAGMQSREQVDRFLREGRAVAKLANEHICRVFDLGTLATGEPFMAMEYLEGTDLLAILSERRRLPVAEAIELISQACVGLAVAHANGIIHRDLKPANLFVTRAADGEPLVKVLDFGISKIHAVQAPADSITSASTFIGTPAYMSPEQLSDSRTVDSRTDIWALGAILYEALTGKRTFESSSVPLTLVNVLNQEPKPPSELQPDLPKGLDDVVMRCLDKQPRERFGAIDELVYALAVFGDSLTHQRASTASKILSAPIDRSGPNAIPSALRKQMQPLAQVVRSDGNKVEPIGDAPTMPVAAATSVVTDGAVSVERKAQSSAASKVPIVAAVLLIAGAAALFLRSRPAPTPSPVPVPSMPASQAVAEPTHEVHVAPAASTPPVAPTVSASAAPSTAPSAGVPKPKSSATAKKKLNDDVLDDRK